MMTYILLLVLLLLSLDSAAAGKRGPPSATSGHAASSNALQEPAEAELIVEGSPALMEVETDVYDATTTGLSHIKVGLVPIADPVDARMYDFAAALKASLVQSEKRAKDAVQDSHTE